MKDVFTHLFGQSVGGKFLTHYWPNSPARASRRPLRFQQLNSELLAALQKDLRLAGKLLPNQSIELFDSTVGTMAHRVSATEAYDGLMKKGMTVRLRRVDLLFADVGRLLHDFTKAVSAQWPVRRAFANLLISPPGWSCVPHFDGHEVVVLNLTGIKEWTFAPTDRVSFPCIGFELGSNAPAMLQLGVSPESIRSQLPASAPKARLTPGDVLFLPRGYYHQTLARSLSMQITFSIETFNRVEIATAALFRTLLRDARWRRLCDTSEVTTKAGLRRTMTALATSLREQMIRPSPLHLERFGADLFSALSCAFDISYCLNPFAQSSLVVDGERSRLRALGPAFDFELELTGEWKVPVKWLLRQKAPFTAADFSAACSLAHPDGSTNFLNLLTSEGLLWRTGPAT